MPITFNGSGTVTGISAGGLPDGCITAAELATGVGGKMLQVNTVEKTGAYTNGSAGTHDVTGFSVTMDAPASSSSKYFVIAMVTGQSNGGYSNCFLLNGTTTGTLTLGDASGNRARRQSANVYNEMSGDYSPLTQTLTYLDSPSTSATQTYKVQVIVRSGTGMYVNRSVTDNNSTNVGRYCSTLTVMEIGG